MPQDVKITGLPPLAAPAASDLIEVCRPAPAASYRATLASVPAPAGAMQLLFVLRNADLTLTTDQAFTKVFTGTKWALYRCLAIPISGAPGGSPAGGIYTAPAKGGTIVVVASTSFSTINLGTGIYVAMNPAASGFLAAPALYLSLTTGSSNPLTADLFAFGLVLD